MLNPFLDLPYTINGPVWIIAKNLTDVRNLWLLSITCKESYSLFWIRSLYYKMLVKKCREQP